MKKQSNYKHILIKGLGSFLAVYLLSMIILTGYVANYYVADIDKNIERNADKIADCIAHDEEIKAQSGEDLSTGESAMWREGNINRITEGYWLFMNNGKQFKNEAQMAVYDEDNKEWIAKTGNCLIFESDNSLEVNADLLNQFKEEDFIIYAPLYIEHYLTQEQMDLVLKDEHYGRGTFRVEGYYSEGEIIPQKLEQYEVILDESDTSKILSKQLMHTYSFDYPVDKTKMIPFIGESSHFFSRQMQTSSYYNDHEGEWDWSEYNKALVPNIEELLQEGKTQIEQKKSLFKVMLRKLTKLNVEGNNYWLSSYIVRYPLYEAVYALAEIYLKGIAVVISVTVIYFIIIWTLKRLRQ